MEHIKGFFQKYLSRIDSGSARKSAALAVLREISGLDLPASGVNSSSRSSLDTSKLPAHYRHIIFLRKEEILRRFRDIPDTRSITDIR